LNRLTKIIAFILPISLILAGCASPQTATRVPGLAQTLAVRTMVALRGISYFATETPSPTPTFPVFFEVPESPVNMYPTDTPVPSLTPFGNSIAQLADTSYCNNKAEFIQDITVLDQTEMKPGERFRKTWRLMNVGTCTWDSDYSIVFTYGDRMQGLSPKLIGSIVQPGDTIDVSIDLIAPKLPNYYQGNWMLQDNEGNTFSCGGGTRAYFWVSVIVGERGIRNIFRSGCGGGG
jgi:hypothetical protein